MESPRLRELPRYVLYIGKSRLSLELASRPDDMVALKTTPHSLTFREANSVSALEEPDQEYLLEDILDEDSSVPVKLQFKVVRIRGELEKVILSYSHEEGPLEAFPMTNHHDSALNLDDNDSESEVSDEEESEYEEEEGEDDDEDTFTYFTIREEVDGLSFMVKLQHIPDPATDTFVLRFCGFKLYVPLEHADHILEGENIASLVHMNWVHNIAAECNDVIAEEFIGDQLLIEAPFKGARRKVSKIKRRVTKKAKSAYRGGKKKVRRAKKAVKKKVRSVKKSVRRTGRSVKRKVSSKIPKSVKGKFNSLRGKSPKGGRKAFAPAGSKRDRRLASAATKTSAGQKLNRGEKKAVKKFNQQQKSTQKKQERKDKKAADATAKVEAKKNAPSKEKKQSGSSSASPTGSSSGSSSQKGSSGGGSSGGGGGSGGGGVTPGQDQTSSTASQGMNDDNNRDLNAAALGFAGGATVGAVGVATLARPGPYATSTPPPMAGPPPGSYGVPQVGPYAGNNPYGQPSAPQQIPDQARFQTDVQQPSGQSDFSPQLQAEQEQAQQTRSGGAAGGERQNYGTFKVKPKLVPESEETDGNVSPLEDEPIQSELISVTIEEVVSRKTRIVNNVARIYAARFGVQPSPAQLASLRSHLDRNLIITAENAVEAVVDWMLRVMMNPETNS